MEYLTLISGERVKVDDCIYEKFSSFKWRICAKTKRVKTSDYINGRRERTLFSVISEELSLAIQPRRPIRFIDGDIFNYTQSNLSTNTILDYVVENNQVIVTLLCGNCVRVDVEDFHFLQEHRCHINNSGYAVFTKGKKKTTLHREIMLKHFKEITNIDHADGNKLNNTKINLRNCTQAQNLANTSKFTSDKRTFTSAYSGVSKGKPGRFVSRLANERLGIYTNEIAAANAYNHRLAERYGEFAYINDVPYMCPSEVSLYRVTRQQKGGETNE